jgi:hypothetical protein
VIFCNTLNMYARRGAAVEALVYDFQCVELLTALRASHTLCMYCGRAAAAKDLAYFCNVQAQPAEEERLLLHYHAVLSELLRAQGDTPPRSRSQKRKPQTPNKTV